MVPCCGWIAAGHHRKGESAAAALRGQDRPFTATPWFWSDQYDKMLQMAALSLGADTWAVRGNMASGSFSVYHFQGPRLLAADSVNAAKDLLQARKLLDAGVALRGMRGLIWAVCWSETAGARTTPG